MPPALPVARVYVDLGLPHLDRPFDYEVPDDLDEIAVAGSRVRVRFAGRQLDGFVVERTDETDQQSLAPISKAVSPECVMPPSSVELIRAVADHYGGTFSDVARLAIPPRHAATETAARSAEVESPELDVHAGVWDDYPGGTGFVDALASGASPRAAWTVVPVAAAIGDWVEGFVTAAVATVSSGRSVVIVVPDAKDVAMIAPRLEKTIGKKFVVRQMADLGPSTRYRSFLRGLRGEARVVVGTRAATFAPVADLGLICIWDDGDDSFSDLRAPYPHARDVAAIRANQQNAGFLVAAYSRTCEVQAWIDRDWLRPIALTPDVTRENAPAIRLTADHDAALERDPSARAARLPREAFTVVRRGLTQGPVLVQVPRAGYLAALVCADCGERARCLVCAGPLHSSRGLDQTTAVVSCGWCGKIVAGWRCTECGHGRLKSFQVGSQRTAEELGKAFPGVPIRLSSQGKILQDVPPEPALVVATPGAEPSVAGGYAAALLLDTTTLLARLDLRSAEEALRRWLAACALVRPGGEDGTVLAVGPHDSRALQALVRLDPGGFASRELAERADAGFPPAVRFLLAEGEWSVLSELRSTLVGLPGVATLGPAETADGKSAQLLARVPLRGGTGLTEGVQHFLAGRTARKDQRRLRTVIDPARIE